MGLIRAPAPILGCIPHLLGLGSTDILLNSANARAGLRWEQDGSKTVNEIDIYVASIVGSPSAGCQVFATDSNGNPTGSALADSTSHTPSTIAEGTLTFTGFSLALTDGVTYCAVIRNTHATPASNSFRVPFGNTGALPLLGFGMSTIAGWAVVSSTDGGSSWAAAGTGATCLSLFFSDGTSLGWPYRGQWNTGTGDGIYSSRELGIRFTTPPGPPIRVKAICWNTRSVTGSPTGFLRGRIRLASDNSIVGTGNALSAIPAGNQRIRSVFPSILTLRSGVEYDMLLIETTQSDSSGNRYNLEGTTIPASRAAVPHGMRKVYFDGTSWAVTTTQLPHMGMLLDEQPAEPAWAGESRFNAGWN